MAKTPLFGRLKRLASQAPSIAELTRGVPAGASGLSRRALLGAGVASTGATLLGCSPEKPPSVDPTKPPPHRVAVVGAGLSGLICGYRLAQAGVEVTVFEANTRVGGRILSTQLIRNNTKVVAELGGEFFDTHHQAMLLLRGEFGLTAEDRQLGFANVQNELFWLGGKVVGEDVIAEQFSRAAPIIAKALRAANDDPAALRQLDSTALAYWLAANLPIADFPELTALLKAAFTSEFGLDSDQQSALNLLFLAGSADLASFEPYGSNDQRLHFQGGNGQLTKKLAEALKVRLVTDARLIRLESAGTSANPLYSLSFQSQTQIPMRAQAERVVFALPFSVLARLDLEKLGLSGAKQAAIRDLGYGTGSKLVGAFTSRFWRELTQPQSGQIFSDSAFQQVWDSSLGSLFSQGTTQGVLANLQGGEAGLRANQTPVPDSMAALLSELESIFTSMNPSPDTTVNTSANVRAAFMSGTAQRMHWPSSEFARGSISCYKPGQWALRDMLGRREGNLHFCGEHCSLDFPGLMEGAAETGALVAAEILEDLELPWPAELISIMRVKSQVPQPGFRNDDMRKPGILERLAMVEQAHA